MPQGSADQLQSIMSPNLKQSFGRAQEFAREQNHRALLLEHLLLALTEDPEAAGVLRACNVDTMRLSTDISGYLGRLPEDSRAAPGTEPSFDAELMRVIEAAKQAAQQSPRKVIDGAIVLAAIVGDAKSPAAGLLKTHGMTFDEAIKTLQKASARARTKQYSTSTPRTQPDPPPAKPPVKEPAREPAVAPAPAAAPNLTAATGPSSAGPGQTVDDILAAARARIQQRASPKPEPEVHAKPAPELPATSPEWPPLPSQPFSAPSGPPIDPPPLIARPPPGGAPPAGGTPAGGPPQPAGGPAGSAGTHGPLGLPLTPAGASPAPPLPPGPSLGGTDPVQPPRAFAKPSGDAGPRPALPRWPEAAGRGEVRGEPGEPSLNPRLAGSGGPIGQRRPEPGGRPQARPSGAPARGGAQRPVAGPLVENIPRRMRVGGATLAQVRIGRDKVEALMQLLAAGRTPPPAADTVLARVISVRLVAPDGGFAIDAETPETQWIEVSPSQPQEEVVGWRWAVTPLEGGRHRLQLAVAARTVTRAGISPEAYPPDRFIEITARRNPLWPLVRLAFFILLFTAGIGLGRLSHDKLAQDLMDVAVAIWRNVLGLLVTSGFVAG
jgi:hypothetical protein